MFSLRNKKIILSYALLSGGGGGGGEGAAGFSSAHFLFCCIYSGAFWSDFIMEAHIMSLDQSALFGAIWSGFKLFAMEYKQTRMQKINTLTS